MNIRIYQINLGRDSDRVAFQDLEHLPEYQGSADVNSALYDCVFEGDVDAVDTTNIDDASYEVCLRQFFNAGIVVGERPYMSVYQG